MDNDFGNHHVVPHYFDSARHQPLRGPHFFQQLFSGPCVGPAVLLACPAVVRRPIPPCAFINKKHVWMHAAQPLIPVVYVFFGNAHRLKNRVR